MSAKYAVVDASKVPTTIRLDPLLKQGLDKLSDLRGVTLNGLIGTALRDYLARDTLALQQEYEASIQDLQRYVAGDPNFEDAIRHFVEAEVSSTDDPAEGTLVKAPDTPVTTLVRNLLDAELG